MSLSETDKRPPELLWTIVLKNLGLVYRTVNDKCRHSQDRDDLTQEGMIGLFEAARRFDPSRQIAFSTYATPWILKYVLAYYQRKSNDAETDQLEEKHTHSLTVEELSFIRSELSADLVYYLNRLSERERMVVILRWLGADKMRLKEIADQTGLSFQAIHQTEQTAFAKLRNLITTGRIR